MELQRLLELVGDEPVFESSFLLAGEVNPAGLRLQLSRWTKAGRLIQLRRGLYALAPPYQKTKPHPFEVANRMRRASYVSCQSALAYYGLIPEHVPVTISLTTTRPGRWETPMGVFEFRHIKKPLFHGYRMTDLGGEAQAFVATPEKALLDLVYFEPGGDCLSYLRELRLQNLDRLNLGVLRRMAREMGGRKVPRALVRVEELAGTEAEEYETL